MPSRNTLIWIGAAALAVVAAGAGGVLWTHSDFLEQNPADLAVAHAPAEPKAPSAPPAAPAVPAAPAGAPAPADKAPTQTAALEPAFDIVNVDPSGEEAARPRVPPINIVNRFDRASPSPVPSMPGSLNLWKG